MFQVVGVAFGKESCPESGTLGMVCISPVFYALIHNPPLPEALPLATLPHSDSFCT